MGVVCIYQLIYFQYNIKHTNSTWVYTILKNKFDETNERVKMALDLSW